MLPQADRIFWKKIYLLIGGDIYGWAAKYPWLHDKEYIPLEYTTKRLREEGYLLPYGSPLKSVFMTDKMLKEIGCE